MAIKTQQSPAGYGRFIVLEGGEGVGKSTNLQLICDLLQTNGIEARSTREPGGTAFAENLRELLLDARSTTEILPETELLLMFAARNQHLHDVIRPALQAGSWVICDRFTDASYAYQGGGRGLDKAHIEYLERWIQQGLSPDMTLLFDAPVEIGLQRAALRGEADRFEREQAAFFQRVREAYRQRAQQAPDRYRVIDAAQPLAVVQQHVKDIMQSMIADWKNHAV